MSTGAPQPVPRLGRPHPAALGRRIHDLLAFAALALVPLALGLAITVAFPHPNLALVFGGMAGVAGVLALLLSSRYELTLTLLALYLGLLDGPVKLVFTGKLTSALRDVLIGAIVLGIIMRVVVRREQVRLPRLSGWVIAFSAFVLAEALNPHTASILKSLGGWRQQLEWVPFFFFGYMMMRNKHRFRQLFMLLGVIALLNGVVGAYQSRLGPGQLASWGPGYRTLAYGGEGNGLTARTYAVEGQARVRPPALGSDAGFGGNIGDLALPGLLALLAVGPVRKRWPVLILFVGAIGGIASSASRTAATIGVATLVLFAVFAFIARLRMSRALVGLVTTLLVVFVVGSLLIASSGSGIFARQETLTSVTRAEETGGGGKTRSLARIPEYLAASPFGFGLGTSGSAAGFGGAQKIEVEGERVTGGSAYSLLMKELGAPGLLLWIGFTVNVLLLAVTGLRRVADPELRTYLVGAITGFTAMTLEGFSGPTLAVTLGAYLWFVPGIIAYWFAGPGRKHLGEWREQRQPRGERAVTV